MGKLKICNSVNISIIGAGSWGMAVSNLLSDNHCNVTLFEPIEKNFKILKKYRQNNIFLKNIKLNSNILITDNIADIKSSEFIVIVVPTQFIRKTLNKAKKFINKNSYIINLSKGIEFTGLKTPSQIIGEIMPKSKKIKIVSLSGPSHAEEVAKKVPTTVVAASKNIKHAQRVQKIFFTDYFRVYTSNDLTGVELGGALKNIIAIAAGIIDGMNLGDNAKAALITRGLAEIIRFGRYFKAKHSTFSGLSGLGDLFVTATSRHSRNRKFGELLGKGMDAQKAINNIKMVVEGAFTVKAVFKISKKYNIDMPICNEIYNIIYKKKSVNKALADLLKRKPKQEIY